jgi:DNA-binding protein Fis
VSANKKEDAAELLGISKFTIRGWIFRFSLETSSAQERAVNEGTDLPEGYNVESVYRVTAKARLQEILKAHRGNRTAAARALGVGRRTLHHKLAEFGLRHRDKLVSNELVREQVERLDQAPKLEA